jgi:N-acetylglucosaminyl-diphospho-decaprenol L-rhamnosyltransferase
LKGILIAVMPASESPCITVSVLLVGYNSEDALGKYLPKFVASLPTEFEILLIDNDSVDHTVDTFRRIFPRGRVIETGMNLGFAKAVNLGAAEATGEWLLFLNPDAAASATDIEALQQSVAGRSACAAVGPIVDSEGKVIPAGRFPTIWRMFLHSTSLSVLAWVNELFEGHYIRVKGIRRGLRKVDWITGGCMLVRREAWITVGGFTERWFMYAEDIEFCFRLKRCGYEVLLNQDVTVSHEIGQSSAGVDGKTTTVWLENLFDFYSSEIAASSVRNLTWKLVVYAGFAIRSVLFSLLASVRKNENNAREATRFRIYAAKIRPSRADFERRQ